MYVPFINFVAEALQR